MGWLEFVRFPRLLKAIQTLKKHSLENVTLSTARLFVWPLDEHGRMPIYTSMRSKILPAEMSVVQPRIIRRE